MSAPVKRRSYDNSRREAAARETKRDIVAAARQLFVDLGYPSTTFSIIAGQAGVSVQTVYAHFPAKNALLKAVIDQAIVGDDEPVALADRPEVAAIRAESDPQQQLRLHASLIATIMKRAAPIEQMIRSAAAVDAEAAELWDRGTKARQAGMQEFATVLFERGHLREELSVHDAADRIAILMDPEIYRMTVGVRGWTPQEHEDWLAEMLIASLLPSRHR